MATKKRHLVTEPFHRDPSNQNLHKSIDRSAERAKGAITPARAAKLRREEMELCGCRLCAWALYPPTSFAEYEALAMCPVVNPSPAPWNVLTTASPLDVIEWAGQHWRVGKVGVLEREQGTRAAVLEPVQVKGFQPVNRRALTLPYTPRA